MTKKLVVQIVRMKLFRACVCSKDHYQYRREHGGIFSAIELMIINYWVSSINLSMWFCELCAGRNWEDVNSSAETVVVANHNEFQLESLKNWKLRNFAL